MKALTTPAKLWIFYFILILMVVIVSVTSCSSNLYLGSTRTDSSEVSISNENGNYSDLHRIPSPYTEKHKRIHKKALKRSALEIVCSE